MALTVSAPYTSLDVFGTRRVAMVTVTFDSSYAVGGEAFDPNLYGIVGVPFGVFISVRPFAADASYVVQYDKTNEKLMVFEQSDSDNNVPLSEVETTVDLSALICDLLIISAL